MRRRLLSALAAALLPAPVVAQDFSSIGGQ